MIEVNDILYYVVDKWCSDTEFAQWTTAEFGTLHKVLVGADHNSPPSEDDFPALVIYEIRIAGAQESYGPPALHYYNLSFMSFVKNSEMEDFTPSQPGGYPNLFIMKGFRLVSELRRRAEELLIKVKGSPWKVFRQGETQVYNRFPVFGSLSQLQFSVISKRRR